MESPINKRVLELKTHLDLTDVEFCGRASISTGTLNKIKNDGDVSASIYVKIIEAFKVSREWLLSGRGDMFVEPVEQIQVSNPYRDYTIQHFEKEIEFLRGLVETLSGKRANFPMALNRTGANKKALLGAAA